MKKISLNGLDEEIYFHTTKEGLPIYIWQNKKVNGKYLTLSVKYGSNDTDFKIGNNVYHVPQGIAHFLEHIKFNIDKDTTAHDIFNQNGADANAYTTFLFTSYVVFTTDNVNNNLNTLLDFVYNPYFTKQIIAKEKPIIIEEANMGKDNPYNYAYFSQLQQIFSKSHYRNTIVGDEQDINSITLDDIELVYNTFYHPQNMFLIVTGNVNPYEIAKVCDENLEQKQFNEYQKPRILIPKEDRKIKDIYKEEECNMVNSRIRYALKIPKKIFCDFSKLELKLYFEIILQCNFGITSDFNEELIGDGLISTMYPSVLFMDEYIIVNISVTTDYPQEVMDRIQQKFTSLDLKKEDFLRKQKVNIANLILQFDNVEVVNDSITDDLIEYNELITDIKNIYECLTYENAINIMKSLNEYPNAVYVMKPKKNKTD